MRKDEINHLPPNSISQNTLLSQTLCGSLREAVIVASNLAGRTKII
jgi:hypothetical protein